MAWSSTDRWPGAHAGAAVFAHRRLATLLAASVVLHAVAITWLQPRATGVAAAPSSVRSLAVFMIQGPRLEEAVLQVSTQPAAAAPTPDSARISLPPRVRPATGSKTAIATAPASTAVSALPAVSAPAAEPLAATAEPTASVPAVTRSWSPFGHSAPRAGDAQSARFATQGAQFAGRMTLQPAPAVDNPCLRPEAPPYCLGR